MYDGYVVGFPAFHKSLKNNPKMKYVSILYITSTRNRAGLAECLNKDWMIEPILKPLTKQKE